MNYCDAFSSSVSTYEDITFESFVSSISEFLSEYFDCEIAYVPCRKEWICVDAGKIDEFYIDNILSAINRCEIINEELKKENNLCVCILANMLYNIFNQLEILDIDLEGSQLYRFFDFSIKCSRFPYITCKTQKNYCKNLFKF